jgi:glycosyltransferase involved in cell wall biosynthesis
MSRADLGNDAQQGSALLRRRVARRPRDALRARDATALPSLAARGGPAPLVVVGFGGQLDVLLARVVCRPRAGLVFAPLVTLSETLVEDRRVFPARGVRSRALAALDRATLRAADLILADTTAHAEYLVELGAARERIGVFYLGAEPEFLPARPPAPVARRVLFYGRHLPLHGVETIVGAAGVSAARPTFVLIGAGPERARVEASRVPPTCPIAWRDDGAARRAAGRARAGRRRLGVFDADGRPAWSSRTRSGRRGHGRTAARDA